MHVNWYMQNKNLFNFKFPLIIRPNCDQINFKSQYVHALAFIYIYHLFCRWSRTLPRVIYTRENMAKLMLIVLFCILNVITLLPHVTNASCQSNGPYSPPYSRYGTHATLTLNDFGPNGDRGDPSEYDENYHPLLERVVALSTGWYSNSARCG